MQTEILLQLKKELSGKDTFEEKVNHIRFVLQEIQNYGNIVVEHHQIPHAEIVETELKGVEC